MIYTTMTRAKVLRLVARGWKLTEDLEHAVYSIRSDYYEVCRRNANYLDGVAYEIPEGVFGIGR